MLAKHKLAVVSVEGDDDSPLRAAQPQDILVGCARRDFGHGKNILAERRKAVTVPSGTFSSASSSI